MSFKSPLIIQVWTFLTATCVLLLSSTPANAQGRPLIISVTCNNQDDAQARTSQQTGFAIARTDGVITALHGVAACLSPHITVTDPVHNQTTTAKIIRANLDYDIAVLELDKSSSLSLQAFIRGKETNVPIKLLGFPHGVPTALVTRIRLREKHPVSLASLIPTGDGLTRLTARQSPTVDSKVLSVEGHLTLGHSGAPILDSSGKVVGIANGGLEKGSTEIGWAIPIDQIDRLQSFSSISPEQKRRLAETSDLLFSQMPSTLNALPGNIKCAKRKFTLIRGVFMSSIAEHLDDPETYRHLLLAYGLHGQQQEFGVYRTLEKSSGEVRIPVTLVVPVGWSIRGTDTGCVATAPDNVGISIQFSVAPVRRLSRSHNTRELLTTEFQKFEYNEFCGDDFIVDQRLSNPMARVLGDRGLITQRRSYMSIEHRCGMPMMPLTAWGDKRPWVRPIGPAPRGLYQCMAPMCPVVNQVQTIPYPDAWGQWLPFPVSTYGIGFLSVVASKNIILFASMKIIDTNLFESWTDCTISLSQSDECKITYSRYRAWGFGVLAATASTLME